MTPETQTRYNKVLSEATSDEVIEVAQLIVPDTHFKDVMAMYSSSDDAAEDLRALLRDDHTSVAEIKLRKNNERFEWKEA